MSLSIVSRTKQLIVCVCVWETTRQRSVDKISCDAIGQPATKEAIAVRPMKQLEFREQIKRKKKEGTLNVRWPASGG